MIDVGREGEMKERLANAAGSISDNRDYATLSSARGYWQSRGLPQAADLIWTSAARAATKKQGLENLEWFAPEEGDLGLEGYWRSKEQIGADQNK